MVISIIVSISSTPALLTYKTSFVATRNNDVRTGRMLVKGWTLRVADQTYLCFLRTVWAYRKYVSLKTGQFIGHWLVKLTLKSSLILAV